MAASLVMVTLAASLATMTGSVVAADCSPGQKKNLMGVCIGVELNPNVDLFDGKDDDGVIISPEMVDRFDDAVNADQGPVADPGLPDIGVNPDSNGEHVDIPIDGPLVDLPETGSAWVSITERNCPDGFDAYNADVYELAFECQGIPVNVKFLVADGNGNVSQKLVDLNGSVEFTGLQAEPYSILAQIPAGFDEPVVKCESYTPQYPTGQPFEASIDAGNQFLHLFEADEQLSCAWYNVPAA